MSRLAADNVAASLRVAISVTEWPVYLCRRPGRSRVMFSRQAVIDRWQQCLAESESRLSSSRPRGSASTTACACGCIAFCSPATAAASGGPMNRRRATQANYRCPSPMPLVETAATVGGQAAEGGRVDPHRAGAHPYGQRGRRLGRPRFSECRHPAHVDRGDGSKRRHLSAALLSAAAAARRSSLDWCGAATTSSSKSHATIWTKPCS